MRLAERVEFYSQRAFPLISVGWRLSGRLYVPRLSQDWHVLFSARRLVWWQIVPGHVASFRALFQVILQLFEQNFATSARLPGVNVALHCGHEAIDVPARMVASRFTAATARGVEGKSASRPS